MNNSDAPAAIQAGTYCDPSLAITSPIIPPTTIEFTGNINIADPAYKELIDASDDGIQRALDIILTGRKVSAEEAHRIGLCERVVPRGTAREAAEALAREIARFPQGAVRADRQSAYETHALPVRDALALEWLNGVPALAEAVRGAGAFASGKGRHGDFTSI